MTFTSVNRSVDLISVQIIEPKQESIDTSNEMETCISVLGPLRFGSVTGSNYFVVCSYGTLFLNLYITIKYFTTQYSHWQNITRNRHERDFATEDENIQMLRRNYRTVS